MKRSFMICFLLTTTLLQVSAKLFRTFPNAKLSEVEWNTYYDREENVDPKVPRTAVVNFRVWDESARKRKTFRQFSKGPGTYSFGYDIDDAESGNTQFRQEERFPNGTVEGSYGLTEADGNVRTVYYTADHLGYRVRIENSLRKNEDYPPRRVQQQTIPSWILQQTKHQTKVQPIAPPSQLVSNAIEASSNRVPLLSYYRGKFYPIYVNGPISRWILPNNYPSKLYSSLISL